MKFQDYSDQSKLVEITSYEQLEQYVFGQLSIIHNANERLSIGVQTGDMDVRNKAMADLDAARANRAKAIYLHLSAILPSGTIVRHTVTGKRYQVEYRLVEDESRTFRTYLEGVTIWHSSQLDLHVMCQPVRKCGLPDRYAATLLPVCRLKIEE